MKKKLFSTCFFVGFVMLFGGCTNLDETLYDRVGSNNFFNSKADIYRAFARAYDHSFSTIQGEYFQMQEDPADQFMTPNRQGRWFDGGTYYRLHYHTWTAQEGYIAGAWNALYGTIAEANNSIEDLQQIDGQKFGLSDQERKQLIAELRTMRAWNYMRLLDLFRNIPLSTKIKGESTKIPQSSPQETFAFIEKELKEAANDLLVKGAAGTEKFDGRWTKAGAMALLVRLYLNAAVYTGQDRYTDCATIAQDIINGKYGSYAIETRWDAPFDWNNNVSPETIFAFPGSFGRSPAHYSGGMYWWMSPFLAAPYFQFTDMVDTNPKFALQPGRDVLGKEYDFPLGKTFLKFQKYPDDVRLKLYKNLGNSTREGMFLYGYLQYNSKDTVKSTTGYTIYARDQVGIFNRSVGGKLVSLKPGEIPTDTKSDMTNADQNSGIYMTKYPIYPSTDPKKMESDYADVRLAEIYYSLAECKFRAGDKAGASTLLNVVRKRYYPANSGSLYDGSGSQLTEQELLDEWGREFLGEGRRRIDLIRFEKFNAGVWWDKQPDADKHTAIFPIAQTVLTISPQLKQNPGY